MHVRKGDASALTNRSKPCPSKPASISTPESVCGVRAQCSALQNEVVLQVARNLEELGERGLVHDFGHRVRQHVLGVGEERHDVLVDREVA